jgi:hypothetical protein
MFDTLHLWFKMYLWRPPKFRNDTWPWSCATWLKSRAPSLVTCRYHLHCCGVVVVLVVVASSLCHVVLVNVDILIILIVVVVVVVVVPPLRCNRFLPRCRRFVVIVVVVVVAVCSAPCFTKDSFRGFDSASSRRHQVCERKKPQRGPQLGRL